MGHGLDLIRDEANRKMAPNVVSLHIVATSGGPPLPLFYIYQCLLVYTSIVEYVACKHAELFVKHIHQRVRLWKMFKTVRSRSIFEISVQFKHKKTVQQNAMIPI